MNSQVTTILIFIIYLAGMIGIGAFFYGKTKSLSGYVLGERKLGKWVTSISAQASDMSGWLLMGLPGAAYFTGLSGALWMALGLALGTYLNWKIIAKRLRIYTEKMNNAITLSSYFENRFEDRSKILRLTSSLLILVFFLIYTASGFVAGGKLFSSIFNLSYIQAVCLGAIVVVLYTFLGGFMAVCWTDLIQGILMFITIVILPIFIVVKLGGVSEVLNTLDPEILNPFLQSVLIPSGAESSLFMMIIGVISSMAWGLGYFGQPHILSRFMAINEPKSIDASRRIAMIWVVISLCGAICIGLIGNVVFDGLSKGDSENVFIYLVGQYTPVFIGGVLLSAVLAAIMSTADSQLLVTASAVSEDFYKGLLKPRATEKELVWVGRLTVVGVAMIALVIALNPNNSVLDLVSWAWAGFGASFGPVIILSLFWKKMTKQGAFSAMLIGGLIVLLWPMFNHLFPDIWVFYIYEIVPAFIIALLVGILVSKCCKQEMEKMQTKLKDFTLN